MFCIHVVLMWWLGSLIGSQHELFEAFPYSEDLVIKKKKMCLFICAQGYLHHLDPTVWQLDSPCWMLNEVLDCVCVCVCVSEMEEQEVSMVSVGSLADGFFPPPPWFQSFQSTPASSVRIKEVLWHIQCCECWKFTANLTSAGEWREFIMNATLFPNNEKTALFSVSMVLAFYFVKVPMAFQVDANYKFAVCCWCQSYQFQA